MKKSSVMFAVLGCACFLMFVASMVRAEDAASTVSQLSSELQQSGVVTQSEAEAIKAPLQNMAEKGATKEELKDAVIKLSGKEVKGDDLKQSVDSMNDLVNKGESPKEAGNVVSQAAAQAHEQGLRGKDLAAKVHEAIQQRKVEKDKTKERAEKARKASEEKTKKEGQEKVKKESQEKTKKAEKETQQKGKKKVK